MLKSLFAGLLLLDVAAAVAGEGAVLRIASSHGQTRSFRIDELAALPQVRLVTKTEYTDAAVVYEGPLARDVLRGLVGAGVSEARMIAMNDYEVVIPLSDFERYDVVMALRQNGAVLSRRDKGPIWLMYPVDQHSELVAPHYDDRLIWQLVDVWLQ